MDKKSMISCFLIPILFLHTITNLANGSSPDFGVYKCRNTGNFTTATYQKNLETALGSLLGNVANHGGFYHSTAGNNTSTPVNALALCRGYLQPEPCEACVNNSIPSLRRNCPNQKEGAAWYSNCMVRYSDQNMIGVLDNWTFGQEFNMAMFPDVDEFNTALTNLTTMLQAEAAGGDSFRKVAVGDATFGTDSLRIFVMMQCTPDLSREQCSECLSGTLTELRDCCSGRVFGWVFYPSCFTKYSNALFYNDTPAKLTSDTIKSHKKSNTAGTIYVIVAAIAVSVALTGIGIWLLLTKTQLKDILSKKDTTSFSTLVAKQKQISTNDTVGMDESVNVQSLKYDLKTIEVATDYFSAKNKIGRGGFGLVYKGVLANGQEVAVKRLSETSSQGVGEFINEAVLVAKLQHRNLVRLLGFCHQSKEKILVYEYVPNQSLDYFLFDSINHGHLDWATRWKIIGGITRGLLYLHEDSRLRIIHRDLKTSNILLDQNMNAKIADFGLARTFRADQTLGNTMKVAGTLGYMSPEYAMHGHFSVKSDVFSFGVIVLELVSGQRNSSFYQDDIEDLLRFAWKRWTDGRALELLDPSIAKSTYVEDDVIRCINIGLLCVQEDPNVRPSMASILNMLNNNSVTLPEPEKPPFFLTKGTF